MRSSELICPQASPEALNLFKLPYKSATQIEIGRLITEDATTGYARLATHTDLFAYLNWLDTETGSTRQTTTHPTDASALDITVETGGMTGIVGVGALFNAINTTAIWVNPTDITVGSYVCADNASATGLLQVVAAGSITGRYPFGIIVRKESDRTWFTFTTMPDRA